MDISPCFYRSRSKMADASPEQFEPPAQALIEPLGYNRILNETGHAIQPLFVVLIDAFRAGQ